MASGDSPGYTYVETAGNSGSGFGTVRPLSPTITASTPSPAWAARTAGRELIWAGGQPGCQGLCLGRIPEVVDGKAGLAVGARFGVHGGELLETGDSFDC